MARKTPIRVGVVGVRRGESFVKDLANIDDMKLVAICDTWKSRLEQAGRTYGVATYIEFDEFLRHEMDAVVLANHFHEHAPFAIKALEAGKHVMSETAANTTLAEGVALCRAVERSGLIYMLAENYAYTTFSQEMRRLYRDGEIGEVAYAEGEYNHPMADEQRVRLAPGVNHWRNWIPSTYYCTHALAPLMYITDRMPQKVNGLSIARPDMPAGTIRRSDPGSVMLCRMDNGSVFRIFGIVLPGHSNWYRVHGSSGAMELTRGPGYFGPGLVRVWHEEWQRPDRQPCERAYLPDWPEGTPPAARSNRSEHGGADFWTSYQFAQAITANRQPYLDVYRAVAMSSVGILGWRSALADGAPFEVPDFASEADRARYADDHWSPWPEHAGPGQPPPSILGDIEPSPEALENALRIWQDMERDGSP